VFVTEANPFLQFTDADLKAALRRALRTIAILAMALASILAFIASWQTAALLLVGAAVSGTGLYEWEKLIALINAKLDNQKTPRSTGFVVTMFFLRFGIAVTVLYVSLKCFHGSLYALVGGLGLAVVALTIEAVRLVRSA
jgi:hypothetical protein